jgi:catechol 2,3-dioxygenase-like lactoylglutathione lyase family enzyme
MKVKHLDHVNLSVRSFDESADWYRRLFGFRVVEEEVTDGVRWGVLRSGDAMLCIYEHPEREFADRFDLGKRKLHGLAHFALRITDAEEWEGAARREDVPINYGGEVSWPNSRSWYVNDPTGYEIEVVCWNGDAVRFAPR